MGRRHSASLARAGAFLSVGLFFGVLMLWLADFVTPSMLGSAALIFVAPLGVIVGALARRRKGKHRTVATLGLAGNAMLLVVTPIWSIVSSLVLGS